MPWESVSKANEQKVWARPLAVQTLTVEKDNPKLGRERKIRVLFTNASEFFGSPMQVHYQILKHLDPNRFDLFLATNRLGDSAARFARLEHVSTNKFYLGRAYSNGFGLLSRVVQALSHIPAMVGLLRLLWLVRRRQIDIIHSTSEPRAVILALILSFLSRSKLVIYAHVWNLDRDLPRRLGVAWALRRADAVIADSDYIRSRLIDFGLDPAKTQTIRLVVDLDAFHPGVVGSRIRREFGIEPGTPLIVSVGRITEEKGQQYLLDALIKVKRTVPNIKALFVGWSDPTRLPSGKTYEEELRDYSSQHGLTDTVIFAKPRTDIPEVNAAGDIVFLALAEDEAFGLVALEVMASGKPVIGFRSGAVPEIVVDGTGILVSRGNAEELAEAIVSLAECPRIRCALGESARRRAEQYFYEGRMAEEVCEAYESIMGFKALSVE